MMMKTSSKGLNQILRSASHGKAGAFRPVAGKTVHILFQKDKKQSVLKNNMIRRDSIMVEQ